MTQRGPILFLLSYFKAYCGRYSLSDRESLIRLPWGGPLSQILGSSVGVPASVQGTHCSLTQWGYQLSYIYFKACCGGYRLSDRDSVALRAPKANSGSYVGVPAQSRGSTVHLTRSQIINYHIYFKACCGGVSGTERRRRLQIQEN